jgi:hypothetical protein
MASSLSSRATAALLGCGKALALEPALLYRALSLLADRYLPLVGAKPLAVDDPLLEPTE